ncbi:DUF4386 domain-containing protein [uncultured Microscilla sp.]|uniref:DUF4386 domain-containing protein n=1 Tax=uncultured Microscilla sp. TaxID=432653 RepID=UPI002635B815|nr:DUF4386 domain-containing protein [uncultured Microscilla sp.]
MFANISSKQQGKIAGWLYIMIAALGIFSIAYVPSVIVSEQAAITLQNLKNHLMLFKWGVFADILIGLFEVVLTALLYQIFCQVGKITAIAAAYARILMVAIMGVNLLVYLAPLLVVSSSALSQLFTSVELARYTQIAFRLHAMGILIWGFFFGLHLLFLSWLVIKSPKHPTWLGYIMWVGSLGYLLESFNKICLGNNAILAIVSGVLLAAVVIGELGFGLWLMVRGEKE